MPAHRPGSRCQVPRCGRKVPRGRALCLSCYRALPEWILGPLCAAHRFRERTHRAAWARKARDWLDRQSVAPAAAPAVDPAITYRNTARLLGEKED